MRQGGSDRLWDDVQNHLTRWKKDGAPALDRFEITVTPDRRTITWPA
ncbi:hypothetical protein ACFWBC_04700 [Streptomyces sp. NPDC059985]